MDILWTIFSWCNGARQYSENISTTKYLHYVGKNTLVLCNDSGNTAQKNGNRGKRTNNRA